MPAFCLLRVPSYISKTSRWRYSGAPFSAGLRTTRDATPLHCFITMLRLHCFDEQRQTGSTRMTISNLQSFSQNFIAVGAWAPSLLLNTCPLTYKARQFIIQRNDQHITFSSMTGLKRKKELSVPSCHSCQSRSGATMADFAFFNQSYSREISCWHLTGQQTVLCWGKFGLFLRA